MTCALICCSIFPDRFVADNLRLMSDLAALDFPHKQQYHMLVLATLGGLISNHSAFLSALKEGDTLSVLVECIGWSNDGPKSDPT